MESKVTIFFLKEIDILKQVYPKIKAYDQMDLLVNYSKTPKINVQYFSRSSRKPGKQEYSQIVLGKYIAIIPNVSRDVTKNENFWTIFLTNIDAVFLSNILASKSQQNI